MEDPRQGSQKEEPSSPVEPEGPSVAVDIAFLVARDLMDELKALEGPSAQDQEEKQPATFKIGEVEGDVRSVDRAAYDPRYVAIGPYQRKRHPDLARDDEKMRLLQAVLSTRDWEKPEEVLHDCLDKLARREGEARSYYAHPFSMESKEFVRMLLLDAFYLIVHLIIIPYRGEQDAMTQRLRRLCPPQQRDFVLHDMVYMLENQIPFFVVMLCIERFYDRREMFRTLVDEIEGNVQHLMPREWGIERWDNSSMVRREQAFRDRFINVSLLHLLHQRLTAILKVELRMQETPPAGGVTAPEFRSRPLVEDKAYCILNVRLDYRSGTLEIPPLDLDKNTWCLLRNLMALEQSNPHVGSYVTAYCFFMSQLASTPWLVQLLSTAGILVFTRSNPREVAGRFADLCIGFPFDADDAHRNYLMNTYHQLKEWLEGSRSMSRRRQWKAWLWWKFCLWMKSMVQSLVWLQQKYFSNVWITLGLIAGTNGLVCTVVQTVFTVKGYKPN